MRPAECLYSLAKTRRRPAVSSAAKEQSSYDSAKERAWHRLWDYWFQREERGDLPRVSQVAEIFCGQARCGDQLGAYSRVARLLPLARWPGERAFAKKMHMQMRNTFARIWSAIDDDAVAAG